MHQHSQRRKPLRGEPAVAWLPREWPLPSSPQRSRVAEAADARQPQKQKQEQKKNTTALAASRKRASR